MTGKSHIPRRLPPAFSGKVPVYAVVGPTAGTVASNLTAMIANSSECESATDGVATAGGVASTLLVNANDSLSTDSPHSAPQETPGASGSYSLVNMSPGIRVLLDPGETTSMVEIIQDLRREEFDSIVVACGSSGYATEWIKAADSVVVSSSTSRELYNARRNVDRLRRTEDLLLAPMGHLKLSEKSAEYPVFRLPSSKNADFEQVQKTRETAALMHEEIGRAFEGSLQKLLTMEEVPCAPQEDSEQLREETETGPEETPKNSHQKDTGGPSSEEQGTRRLSADEMVERMRRGAQRPGDFGDAEQQPESPPPELPKTGLQKLKGSVASFLSDKPPRRDGQNSREDVADADSSQEIENRLKLSLRETTVGGISRVCVGSPKGGVGKSSIAYALAGSVAYYTNLRVCLVDTDPNFGSMRLLVPRPVKHSVVSLAKDADDLEGLSDIRSYVAQNERMRLDVVLGPEHAHEMARLEDLGKAYGRIDSVLSKFYDLVVYDLGLGFRDPAIRRVLELSDELLFVTDSEVIPNAMLSDAIRYVEGLGVDLEKTTLVLNHRLPASDESALALQVRNAHTSLLRRVTEVPYDAQMSRLLNRRSFHIEDLSAPTRLGILTTVAACLEGLRTNRGPEDKVVAQSNDESNV